ncbi:MAG: serine/threonine-protein kinase [Sandaracinaceae bacterium]
MIRRSGTEAAHEPSEEAQLRGFVVGGRYRLETPIGTGGMATVWKATHLALNRRVAVKFIDRPAHTARTRERFLREARVAAAVHHRNVVDIIDFGTTDDGRPYMVMELLVGETLADRMDRAPPLGVGSALAIMARLLSGLGAVHDAGIVHRDLKPENVFLVADPDGVFPKLLDFGVSRAVAKAGNLESVYPTTDNAIVGTPQYMSPEQARGLKDLDHRADLWSAGVMLFELLTGRLPFDAEVVGDVLIMVATSEPPDFAELRPDLAGPLEHVVKRAMSRRRHARYQDAREMRADLLSAGASLARGSSPPAARRQSLPAHTQPGVPRLRADELLDALGDVYEPGDSGLHDFLRRRRATEGSGPRDRTEPDLPVGLDDSQDVPARRGDRARMTGERSGLRSNRPRPRRAELDDTEPRLPSARPPPVPAVAVPAPRPRAPVPVGVIASALMAAALVGVAGWLWLQRTPPEVAATRVAAVPPEPALVEVVLEGLPPGATVRVDGQERPEGSPLILPRSERDHHLEVVDAFGRRWSAVHPARRDGRYRVRLEGPLPEPSPEPSPEVAPERPAVPDPRDLARPQRPVERDEPPVEVPAPAEGLLRDPGF